jgi:hypothetical protein
MGNRVRGDFAHADSRARLPTLRVLNAWMAGTRPGHDEKAGSFVRMSQPPHEPPETEAERRRGNIALAIGAVILIGGGIWLVNALIDARNAEICMESGRRNCNPIEAPAR